MTYDQILELLRQAAVYIGSGGILVPLIVAFINQAHWSSQAKQIVMFVVSIVVGGLGWIVQNGFDYSNPYGIAVAVMGVIAAAQTAYHGLWKKGGITNAITNKMTALRSGTNRQNIVTPAVPPVVPTPIIPEPDPAPAPTPTPTDPQPAQTPTNPPAAA